MNKHTFPIWYFSHPSSNGTLSNCLSHKNLANVLSKKVSFQRYHRIFNVFSGFGPFVSWKTYSNVWTLRCGNIEKSGSILQVYLGGVGSFSASAACPSQSGHLAIKSITFAAVIWAADEPCSVKTAYAPESSFTMPPRSKTLLWYFCNLGSNSAFSR